MKLIITGATGYVAKEVIRQSLLIPEITSVVALARKPVPLPEGADAAKFKSVVVDNYGTYPADVKEEFAGANTCIWYIPDLLDQCWFSDALLIGRIVGSLEDTSRKC